MPKYHQGKFKPRNPKKYRGDPSNIVYRSSWELKVMNNFDRHPDVLEWSSEEIVVPYISPIDGRKHRYFIDFFVKKRNPDGKVECCLIEVKPKAQTKPPKVQKRVTPRYINEVKTWGVNQAKWDAAEDYCMSKGWKFLIFTETEIGVKF